MYIDQDGNKWYKGNLHMHTTYSDGRLSPEEAIARYRQDGFDFLALTDHWNLSQTIQNDDFLLLSGCEYDIGKTVQEGIFHIVAVGIEKRPALKKGVPLTPQKIVDEIQAAGGIAILAHPAWSLNCAEDVISVEGFAGVEIYNTFSGRPWNARPYSGDFIDALAVKGKLMPCMAADDSHRYCGEECKSFLMVKAQELTRDSILQSISNGDFYATQGPQFEVKREENKIHVTCSPVHDVVFFSDAIYADDRVTRGNDICEAWYEIKPNETFIRVELFDSRERAAWSSPILVNV